MESIEYYELSNPQRRIWRTELLYERREMANIGYLVELKGTYNLDLLARAIRYVVKINRGLQLRFKYADEDQSDLLQYQPDYEEIEVALLEVDSEEELLEKLEELHRQRFDITDKYLCAFAVFSIGRQRYGLFEKAHHLVADGISAVIVAREVVDTYQKLEKQDFQESDKAFSYIDFLKAEKEYLGSEKYARDREYWLKRFENLQAEDITFAVNREKKNSFKVHRGSYRIPADLISALEAYESGQRISNFALFMAAMAIYFHRYFDRREMVIGMPVHNRSGKIFRDMAGMFVSTLPFRIDFEEGWSFNDLVAYLKKELWEDLKHQGYPYNHLDRDLKELNIDTSGLLNVQLIELPGGNDDFLEKRAFFSTSHNISQLSIYLNQQNSKSLSELEIAIDYHVDIFDRRDVDFFFKRLTVILGQAVGEPDRPVRELSLLEEAEYLELVETLNDTAADFPEDKNLARLFEEQVSRNPGNIALEFEGTTVSYGELNRMADNLAVHLQAAGFRPRSIAGLLCERSIEAVAGILAILKAGGAYLPVDPAYPLERKSYIIGNSGLEIMLLAGDLAEQETDLLDRHKNVKIVEADYHSLKTESAGPEPVRPDINSQDPAYVIYTSGTTGQPKGTVVSHRNVVNYACWGARHYVAGGKASFALYSSLSFDLTVTSIFIPLITGNRIVIYRESREGLLIEKVLADNRVEVVKLTPSHLKVVKELKCETPGIETFIVGGEELKTDIARDIDDYFKGDIKIYNEYGPTEATVGCMIHLFDKKRDNGPAVPIGKPADNVKIYILDRNKKPLPLGIIGEIYIGGTGVAAGYLKNRPLTEEKFVDNPFVPGEKMYRSGDLGRWNPDRILEFFGRCDEQVKIRGYRIEPAEIESQILKIEGVKDAVVVMVEDRTGQKSLCAYLVPAGLGEEAEAAAEAPDIAGIRKKLGENLPEYMVPAFFVTLEKIPLTNNGKLDRKSLPEPRYVVTRETDLVPADELEKEVQQIWSGVLGFDNVGLEDNFFELGGDSIKAVQIAARMHDRDLSVNAKDILGYQTIRQLCANVDFKSHIRRYDQGIIEGEMGPTPIEAWFLSQRFKNPHHYNQSVLLELKQAIDIPLLEKAFGILTEHHDGLRLNFNGEKNLFYFNNDLLKRPFKMETVDLAALPEADRVAAVQKRGGEIKGSFDIGGGPMIKAALFREDGQGGKLLITAHHLVIDGLSWRVLLEDLYDVYTALAEGKPVELSKKTASLKEWYDALILYRDSGRLEKEQEYWNTDDTGFQLPLDSETADWSLSSLAVEKARLEEEETGFLLKEAHEVYKTDVQILLVAALVRTLRQRTGRRRVEVELENHGRHIDEIDVSRTVGWFTAIYPLRIMREDRTIGDEIKTVKEAIRKTPNHGIGYGISKYMSTDGEAEPAGRADVRFNYLGQFDREVDNPLFSYSDRPSGADVSPDNRMTAAVEINVMILHGVLEMDFLYNRQAIRPETMASFTADYLERLREILDHIKHEDNVHFTPSDFDTVDLDEEELAALFE